MRFVFPFLAAALTTNCVDKSAMDSSRLETPALRARSFCELTMCPQLPEDVAFRVVAGEVRGLTKISARAVGAWAHGCVAAPTDPRPGWLAELSHVTGWVPASVPDQLRCGRQLRVIHVREGLVIITAPRAD